MPTYKNITAETIDLLYIAVKNQIDFETEGNIPIEDVQESVNENLQGKIDSVDLLSDIQNQLDQIPGRIDDLDTAIAAIPGFSIHNGLKTVLIGLCENQQNLYRINQRQLKAWKFVIKNASFE